MSNNIDILNLHRNIIGDYKSFITSFVNIKNDTIKSFVEKEIESGKFWPEPLMQFNPSFEQGFSIDELCSKHNLNIDLSNIFKGYNLFKHQVEGIIKGSSEKDVVVTSGTGSGKSLVYLGTIFNYLLNNPNDKSIKAVIVYPMNALINSQTNEIEKFKENYEKTTGKQFPLTFAQYTGQEGFKIRQKIRTELPDIILTNYMMLELILTRSKEVDLRNSIFSSLKYLVFDELHTYRGRQGSDVALLIRRIKSQCAKKIVCIGTSATMVAGDTTVKEQKQVVAEIASKLFGSKFEIDQVVNEYLQRNFTWKDKIPTKDELSSCLNKGFNETDPVEKLVTNSLGDTCQELCV